MDPSFGPDLDMSQGSLDGVKITWVSVSQVRLEIGKIRDKDNTWTMELTAPETADITASGVNGLDTGAKANDTWYALHAIGELKAQSPNATKGIFSLSASAPTFPSGYNVSRRVAWVRVNSAGNIVKFYAVRKGGGTLRIIYDEAASNLRPLNNGSETAFTDVSAATFIPPTAESFKARVSFKNNNLADDDVRFRHPDSTINGPPTLIQAGIINNDLLVICDVEILVNATQVFAYKVKNALNNVSVVVINYDDNR